MQKETIKGDFAVNFLHILSATISALSKIHFNGSKSTFIITCAITPMINVNIVMNNTTHIMPIMKPNIFTICTPLTVCEA